jgi:glycerate kinase
MGKVPASVAMEAGKYGVPVIALGGCIGEGAVRLNDCGVCAYFPILQKPCTIAEAMDRDTAAHNVRLTAEQAARLIRAMRTK